MHVPIAANAWEFLRGGESANASGARTAGNQSRWRSDLDKKRRRVSELEGSIAKAEAEITRLADELKSDHGGDWQRLHGLVADKEQLEARVARWIGEWEKLSTELG